MDEELFEALKEQVRAFRRIHGCYPDELRSRWNPKIWIGKWCIRRGCLRWHQSYNLYCAKHDNTD